MPSALSIKKKSESALNIVQEEPDGPPSQKGSPFHSLSVPREPRDRLADSHWSGVLVKCRECNTRLYPCERTLAACRQDLKNFCATMINEKLGRMYDMIDEKIRVEEVINVHGPEVLETRYKAGKTENQKEWNQALFAYKIKHFAKVRREKERNATNQTARSPRHMPKVQEIEVNLNRSILIHPTKDARTTANISPLQQRSYINPPKDVSATNPINLSF